MKISICIPAYRRPANIRRLLKSVASQTFTDFEVIVTDDSPDDSVLEVVSEFPELNINYHKNSIALGTPVNWNFCISLAKGEWIKLMHDDDWFSIPQSLKTYIDSARKTDNFIIARYINTFETGKEVIPAFPQSWRRKVLKTPMLLLSNNVIGPPSVTLIRRSINELYHPKLKWRVDIEYYMRLLNLKISFVLIDKLLINVGISQSQVTNYCINEPSVELPEGILILEKYGLKNLRNILVYDAWWRIFRNLEIRNKAELNSYVPGAYWPEPIYKMINHEAFVSKSLLKIGLFSKISMTLSYLLNRKYLKP